MPEEYDQIHKSIRRACVAAFVTDPMNPSLSLAELRSLVVQDGYAGSLFDEAWPESYHGRMARGAQRAQLQQVDLAAMNAYDEVPPELPQAEALKVLQSFRTLNAVSIKAPKSIEMLAGVGVSTEETRRGLGLLLFLGLAQSEGGGFVCRASSLDGYSLEKTKRLPALEAMIERVRVVFAAREQRTIPTTPPIERFHLFLKKQRLEALAQWWAMTTDEMRSLGERHPTASTVLAGAMLEAALVAIAEPALKANEWRNRDITLKKPADWTLRALIQQAEDAQVFSKSDVALAKAMQDMRNRIHVGKFAVEGPERFKPQFAEGHEAALASKHLELLLARLLDWTPIAALL